jgi:hypothetical protein
MENLEAKRITEPRKAHLKRQEGQLYGRALESREISRVLEKQRKGTEVSFRRML